MRFYYTITSSLLFLFIFSSHFSSAQINVDSLITQRNSSLADYENFKSNMQERTWMNLLYLNQMAEQIMVVDEDLINAYHSDGLVKNKQLNASLEESLLENSLLHKELELQGKELESQKVFNNTMFFTILSVGFLFIVAVGLLINRQLRYKAAYNELEAMWASQEKQYRSNDQNEPAYSKEYIDQLISENTTMKNKLDSISRLKLNTEKELLAEISSRKTAEKEIRALIDQLKK